MSGGCILILKHYQNLILHIHEILNKEIGITDAAGSIIVCSDTQKLDHSIPQVQEFMKSEDLSSCLDGFLFQKILLKNKPAFAVYIKSDVTDDQKFLSLIHFNVLTLVGYYDEKQDKSLYLRNVLIGNVQSGDICIKAQELHITNIAPRVVLLIRTSVSKDVYAFDIIQNLFPNKSKDFAILMNNEEIALIKELRTVEEFSDIENAASIIIDTLSTEIMVKAKIGIGTIAASIEELKKSYTEARTSLEVGSIFNSENSIFSYGKLGIGRLVHQLPQDLCTLFLREIFKDELIESLDTEILHTIQIFFENNLNISEAARKLYVHRNTLVYRLEKIYKLTGFDITKFDSAVTLKVALLVKKYMDRMENDPTRTR